MTPQVTEGGGGGGGGDGGDQGHRDDDDDEDHPIPVPNLPPFNPDHPTASLPAACGRGTSDVDRHARLIQGGGAKHAHKRAQRDCLLGVGVGGRGVSMFSEKNGVICGEHSMPDMPDTRHGDMMASVTFV